MKILFIQKMAGIAGSERYLLSLLPALQQRGVKPTYLLVQNPRDKDKNREFVSKLEQHGIYVKIMNARLPISPLLLWEIYRYLRKEKFDLVQSNLIHSDIWMAFVKCLFLPKLRLVSVKHGYEEAYQTRHGLDPSHVRLSLSFLAHRGSARYADAVISISSALASFYVMTNMVHQDKMLTIPYGFDFSKIKSDPTLEKYRFSPLQLVVVGRLVPVKQHHVFLPVLAKLVEKFSTLSVVMVGDGPCREALLLQTKHLNLCQHVHWVGFKNNAHDYIQGSDLMVVPSSAEGFGLVVLEGWYHKKTVVAFDVPALNEIIVSEKDGILVKPFNTDELFDALCHLLENDERRQELGAAGHKKLLNDYTLESMIERTIAVYETVVHEQTLTLYSSD